MNVETEDFASLVDHLADKHADIWTASFAEVAEKIAAVRATEAKQEATATTPKL